jgi:hypothetical protein
MILDSATEMSVPSRDDVLESEEASPVSGDASLLCRVT